MPAIDTGLTQSDLLSEILADHEAHQLRPGDVTIKMLRAQGMSRDKARNALEKYAKRLGVKLIMVIDPATGQNVTALRKA